MRYDRASCGPSNEPHKISPERAQSGGQGGGRWRRDRRRQVVAPCRTPARARARARAGPLLLLYSPRLAATGTLQLQGTTTRRARAGRPIETLRVTLMCSLSLRTPRASPGRADDRTPSILRVCIHVYTTVPGYRYVRRIAVAVVMAANTYAYTRCDLIRSVLLQSDRDRRRGRPTHL